ncbi:UNVERIFIED_CONTAM: hypothetical protein K2H54_038463 [Gekko kuhli]
MASEEIPKLPAANGTVVDQDMLDWFAELFDSEILTVLPNRFLDRQRIPLILGVKGGSQGISCGKEEEPKLQLEDANLMDVFTNDKEAKRFTFFKSYNGTTHTFESAIHPGWYLSSQVEAHKPLMLTNHRGETAITDFYFHHK